MYVVEGGKPDRLINVPHIYAVSSEQARQIAFKKYPKFRAYVDGCLGRNQECDIVARLDKEKLEEIMKYREIEKSRKEKQVSEAWWNK